MASGMNTVSPVVEGALELRIALEVDDEVADRRILVARDEADLVPVAGEEDRAAVEAEHVAHLARDGLQDVDEVQRRRDLLQDVDDGREMVALALELVEPGAELADVVGEAPPSAGAAEAASGAVPLSPPPSSPLLPPTVACSDSDSSFGECAR